MKSSPRVLIQVLRTVGFVGLLCTSAFAQIGQIDRSKLPQDASVQSVYQSLLPIEQYARTYEGKWRFPISKADMASRLSLALQTLEEAQKQSPSNKELQLFTGLVAHFAYNLDIDAAYKPAMALLQPLSAEDFRAQWFLGVHQCQSNDAVEGMTNLLHVETLPDKFPRAFWQDYANCALITGMPVHGVRAYDNAEKAPDGTSIDAELEQIARNRIKPSSSIRSYPKKQAWYAEQTADQVRFTSSLCGESFATKPTVSINVQDVAKGSCVVTIDTDKYPERHGSAGATLLLLTQIPRDGESLEAYSQRLLNESRYANRTPLSGIPCPATNCLAFEIVIDQMYKSEGGAHLIAFFFQSDQPAYPGLRFESPQPLPKASNTSQPTFLHPGDVFQRFNGPLYTFIALDANQEIYPRARIDFDNLIKSLVVDKK